MKYFVSFLLVLFTSNVMAQSFSINTDGSTANASAILDVKSTTKGMLVPRMSKTEKNAIASPATGLLVFQNAPDSIGFQYYNGTAWLWLEALGNAGWKTTGNAGTDTAVNFIGTTDNMPLQFKQQSQQIALWDRNLGNFSIGEGANKDKGFSNIAIGGNSLRDNTTGSTNTATGTSALLFNTTGFLNTAVGSFAGSLNKTGFENTFIGASANVGTGLDNLTNATAIGYSAKVDTSDALILGNNASVGIGTSKPRFKLHVSNGSSGNVLNASSRIATFEDNTSNYIQLLSPTVNETGILAGNAATLIKSGIVFAADSAVMIRTGGNNTRIFAAKTGLVGIGNTNPQSRLHVSSGNTSGALYFSGATEIIESSGFSALQFMNPSIGTATIISGTELSNARSSISFSPDSSIAFNSPGFSSRMTVKNDGDILIPGLLGIGNTSPQSKLHVSNGTVSGAAYFSLATGIIESASTNFFQFMNPSAMATGIISGTELTNARSSIFFNTDSSIAFNSSGFINRMTVKNDGDILIPGLLGIGNTNPQSKLHVSNGAVSGAVYYPTATQVTESSTAAVIQLMNPSSSNAFILSGTELTNARSGIFFNSDSSIAFYAGGISPRLTILKNGNTGINTTTPSTTLDANGSFKLGTLGTVNTALLKSTVTIDVGSVPANGELDVTVAVANAATTGAVHVSCAIDLPAGIIIGSARVSSPGNVRIRYRNFTGLAIDPPSTSYFISVVQ